MTTLELALQVWELIHFPSNLFLFVVDAIFDVLTRPWATWLLHIFASDINMILSGGDLVFVDHILFVMYGKRLIMA